MKSAVRLPKAVRERMLANIEFSLEWEADDDGGVIRDGELWVRRPKEAAGAIISSVAQH